MELRNTPSNGVKIRYFTNCLEKSDSLLQENATCDGLTVGSLVNYTLSIEVGSWNATFILLIVAYTCYVLGYRMPYGKN